MKVAVIGGLGFIGSHIVDSLISDNHEVYIYDNLSNGNIDNKNEKATVFIGDILEISDLNTFFERVKPDLVCHHAAQIDVQTSMKHPKMDASINVMGTINVLDMCVRHHVKRIVYASSAAIYGNPHYLPVDEKHPLNPESFYGLSKAIPESYIRLYARNNHFSYGILRYANVFGPRQKAEGEGGVVAIFSSLMTEGKDCFIYGDGNQTRDFIYVKDIAKANVLALQSDKSFTVNISTNKEITVNELFQIMKQTYDYQKQANYREARTGDIVNSYLSNKEAFDIIGFEPAYSVVEGIKEMADADGQKIS
ncbi:MAG: NAD-dependent epimerase/dehydratase family protein [Clostridia bacterium]|nr:NAD-dependent epimerase/dehydratase family protein [Clostridia bacterium]